MNINITFYYVRQLETSRQLHIVHVPETISGQSVVVIFVDIAIANSIDLFIIVIIENLKHCVYFLHRNKYVTI